MGGEEEDEDEADEAAVEVEEEDEAVAAASFGPPGVTWSRKRLLPVKGVMRRSLSASIRAASE